MMCKDKPVRQGNLLKSAFRYMHIQNEPNSYTP